MSNPMVMKLEYGASLTEEDRARLESLTTRKRQVQAGTDLICEGARPEVVQLVLRGFACRYKALPNGKRSIMAFLVPGDFCDLHVAILGQMDHSIATLTQCEIVEISRAAVENLIDQYPRIRRALWWTTLVDEATLREWLVNLGRRPASQALAHLCCELLVRMQMVDCAGERSFPLPLTQDQLADALGISGVHLNRMLQQLREDRLIILQGKTVTVPDPKRLKKFAGFNPNYLHLARRPNGQAGDMLID